MASNFIEREVIELDEKKTRMIASGWGEETAENTVTERIVYNSEGLKVKGYLAYPKNVNGKKLPCVIWNRGGIGENGAIDAFTAKGIFGQLASWGYVVFASQYRGNDGSEGKDEFGGGDVNDVLNLMPLAEELEFADTGIWGMEGWSRGGMMTYLAMTKTDKFKAAVITGGIANLRCNAEESRFMRKLYEVTMGDYSSDSFNEKCQSRSIVNFPEKLSAKTNYLIIHGTADDRVSPKDSIEIADKMLELKIPFRLSMLENGDHYLKKHRKETQYLRKYWFEKYLKKG